MAITARADFVYRLSISSAITRSSVLRERFVVASALACLCALGCSSAPQSTPDDSIQIGAILPFTGKEAALGRNIEQAMLLAVEDVNHAGGIDGKPLEVVSRDSNSGSERGLNELLNLIYNDKVQFLVGPEETELANAIVPDIKSLNITNVLPGYAAPSVQRASATGAWYRLAPGAFDIGCAFARHAEDDGVVSANALSMTDDYNATLASAFNQQYSVNGRVLPSVTVQAGESSYSTAIKRTLDFKPERTVLNANPATGSEIITEWAIGDGRGSWYLSPLLRADAFLINVPYGSLDGLLGISPSLSLNSECKTLSGFDHGAISCKRTNATRFSAHFAERWDGTQPFPASRLYYDAVILLAMGMRYALATTGSVPPAPVLHRLILQLNDGDNAPAHWYDLESAFAALATGEKLRFIGSGAEYSFDRYGAAQHVVFDTWTVAAQSFVDTGSYYASCNPI
ncbi:MAG TPA: ABC transporter substrate-binding protein [Polyangiaceae bacterium]|nr:ABC transporter substrate-binding protein [Polyangiaceae bacterium]